MNFSRSILLFSMLILIAPFTSMAQNHSGNDRISWVTLEEAAQLRLKEPRKVMIDVYTDWCGWCKRMDKTTFSDPKVIEYINANYYAVKLDAEQEEPITVGGKTYKYDAEYGRRGVHEIAKELLQGKMSYPTTVFLDENMNMIQPVAGYLDAATIKPILEYLATEAYKQTPWEEWLKQREG